MYKRQIYWVVESWNHLNQQFSTKSWQQLWLSLTYVNSHDQENQTNNVLELVQRIPGCEEANDNDVDEWILEDNEVFIDQEIEKW